MKHRCLIDNNWEFGDQDFSVECWHHFPIVRKSKKVCVYINGKRRTWLDRVKEWFRR